MSVFKVTKGTYSQLESISIFKSRYHIYALKSQVLTSEYVRSTICILSAFFSTGYHSNGVLVFFFKKKKSEQIAGCLPILYFQFIISGIQGAMGLN